MRALLVAGLLLLLGAGALALRLARAPLPPTGVSGTLVFVSDRTGLDSLYMRRLPDGVEVRLTFLDQPVAEPALSPDGTQVAFAVGGRIAVVSLATHDLRFASLGVDARDASPCWRPDGRGLVVVSRRAEGEAADLWLLKLGEDPVQAPRERLLETPADEAEPAVSPDGAAVVFVREDNLYRLDLAGGRVRRLTGGLRRTRQPRFLSSGKLLCLWSEEKRFGIDLLDAAGRGRETLWEGSTCYRTLSPSPDGRHLVATFSYDLGFHPLAALLRRGHEELRLLDASGRPLGRLGEPWRHSDHSAVFGR